MRLLLSWVRDFVNVTASADEIAEKLALRGFEVAEIEPLGANDAVIDFDVTAKRRTAWRARLRPEIGRSRSNGPLPPPEGRQDRPRLLPVVIHHTEGSDRGPGALPLRGSRRGPQGHHVTEGMTTRLQAAGTTDQTFVISRPVLMDWPPDHAFDSTPRGSGFGSRAHEGRHASWHGAARTIEPDCWLSRQATRQGGGGVMGGRASEVTTDGGPWSSRRRTSAGLRRRTSNVWA